MAIYEIQPDSIAAVPGTTFASAGLGERSDLQRLLRKQIDVISEDTLVIAEEFGEWEDSKRRIDLLGIDKDANLVVIELKRTEDGGHMELQAIRYAAMISAMTFDRAVGVYQSFLSSLTSAVDARASMLAFLGWDEPDEDAFGQEVKIVLASAEFSKELTTAVIWLNEQGLDIRCVRLKLYKLQDRLLADVQQVIPLPEAEEYRIRIREKHERERVGRSVKRDLTKYDITINGVVHKYLPKRIAIFTVVKHLCDNGVSPDQVAGFVPWRTNSTIFRSVVGKCDAAGFVLQTQTDDPSRSFDSRRFFCENQELIHYGGMTYAFTNQWGERTVEAIRKLIEAHPEHPMSCVVATGTS